MAYRRRVHTMLSFLDLAPGQTVLDCGTGMGFYMKVISDLYSGLRLFGLDRSERELRYAQGHLRGSESTLIQADAHQLGFASGVFDRVVMSEVLEHLTADHVALQEVWRVMKPNAILALTVPYRHYPYWYDPINRAAEDLFGHPIRRGPFSGIWANHERLYEKDEIVNVVEHSGFTVERLETLTHFCFPGTQTIVYTLGKGLIEHGLLPESISKVAHRFRGQESLGSGQGHFGTVLALFDWFDRFNAQPKRMANQRTFVNLALKARKA